MHSLKAGVTVLIVAPVKLLYQGILSRLDKLSSVPLVLNRVVDR